ncbi:hypothetical protein [Methylobacterium terricola]|nr:hypothetical protein [Methylobacterium terricola]
MIPASTGQSISIDAPGLPGWRQGRTSVPDTAVGGRALEDRLQSLPGVEIVLEHDIDHRVVADDEFGRRRADLAAGSGIGGGPDADRGIVRCLTDEARRVRLGRRRPDPQGRRSRAEPI